MEFFRGVVGGVGHSRPIRRGGSVQASPYPPHIRLVMGFPDSPNGWAGCGAALRALVVNALIPILWVNALMPCL